MSPQIRKIESDIDIKSKEEIDTEVSKKEGAMTKTTQSWKVERIERADPAVQT